MYSMDAIIFSYLDRFVQPPQPTARIEYVENAAEPQGETQEHDCVLPPRVMTAPHMTERVLEELPQLLPRQGALQDHGVIIASQAHRGAGGIRSRRDRPL